MPWMIDPETGDNRRPNWAEVRDEAGVPMMPKDWPEPTYVPPEETWPLPFRQVSKHKVIPDFCGGRWSFTIFVSQAFRELVEAMDPVKHHFIPLDLELHGGRRSVGEYFLFKPGMFVDGIIAEQSEVGPIYAPNGDLGFYGIGAHPRIVWRREAVAGRHVWADKYLNHMTFCSDEFMAEMRKRKMKLFLETESFLSET